jgi:Tol biopolymer transport system component
MRATYRKAAAVLLLLVAAAALVPLLRAQSGESVGSADQVWLVRSDGQALHKVNPAEKFQRDPAWSPDGGRLVFTSRSKGRTVIEIAAADTGAIRRVTVPRRLGNPSAPAWSPRRDELAFAAVREGRFDLRRTIARIRPDGSRLRQLASHPFGAIVESGPVWSPDGSRLAYIRQRKWRPPKHKPAPPVNPTTEALDVVVMSRTGRKHVIRLGGDDADPRWSPDGRRIAFVHQVGRGRFELRTVAPDGRQSRRLGTGLRGPGNPAWSPDSRQIALTAIAADRRPHLFVVDAVGRARQVPVTGLVALVRPAWSPDGKLLAFADYGGHVNVIAPDGSEQRTLATLAGADFFQLAWSPDGRWIAFVAAKHVQET